MEQATSVQWKTGGIEPHQVLASFDLPIYITANQDNLLEAALCQAGKSPRTFLCPWNNIIRQPGGADLAKLEEEELQIERPIVYHLFGSWDQPNSVVLTEDDYFKFLMSLSRKEDLIPAQVRQALVDSSLLFLGFQIEEWSFRVIFHGLLSQPGASRRNLYAHIAAQIELDDERLVEPVRARQYLEQYFNEKESAKIDIYWGSPRDFITDLVKCIESRRE